MSESPKEPIFDTAYWRERLAKAPSDDPHKAIYLINLPYWQEVEEQHRKLLINYIQPNQSILDVGCGWGRLLTLMPFGWYGQYLGIDLSPDFIEIARKQYPERKNQFVVADVRDDLKWSLCPTAWVGDHLHIFPSGVKRDWAILISIKGMIINNAGEDVWNKIKARIKEVAYRILILEYSSEDKGSVE